MTTGTPLVVFSDTTICDRCGLDVDLITDGIRAYALTGQFPHDPHSGNESHLVLRKGQMIEVTCTYVLRDGETCGGTATFNLAVPGTWHPANHDRLQLLSYGCQVEEA